MKLINLPNIITCCNLLCGSMAIFFGLYGQVDLACLCIVMGAVFDFFDGMAARALHISGPVGKELDSLADMVSFGLAPSVLAYQIMLFCEGPASVCVSAAAFGGCCLMAAFSALRLAKFNCDERQSLSFIGLPTPANALFWIGLTYLVRIDAVSNFIQAHALGCGWCFGALLLVMSVLLICELPMFSLKIKPGHMSWAENKVRYSFLIVTVLVLIASSVLGQLAASLAPIILLYILLSCFSRQH